MVGHVEWVQFARVARVPAAGEIVHASEQFEEPAGGGAVAAVQLARLAGGAALFTALGNDEAGERSLSRLHELGVTVSAERRSEPTRRALTLLDDDAQRTITTLGSRLEFRAGSRHGPCSDRGGFDAIYFTAGDLDALRAARAAARVLIASPRAGAVLGHGVALDALVLSAEDEIERSAAAQIAHDAELVVLTEGAHGGSYSTRAGESGRWPSARLPGKQVDAYGCGDSFAGGLTFALGAGFDRDDALGLAARCGAFCAVGRGPYGRQLSAQDL